MIKIIIELGDFGPEACIKDFGQVALTDFYLSCSQEVKNYVQKLYKGDLPALHKRIEMDEEDIEKIKEFATHREETIPSKIDEFKNKLNKKYGLGIYLNK